VFIIPALVQNLVLGKKDRHLRKKLINVIKDQNQYIHEELASYREECADLDDKNEKIVTKRIGKQVTYQITGENLEKLNSKFTELLNESVRIDVLPSDVEYLPQIAEFLENAEIKLNSNDERAVEALCSALRGEEQGVKEVSEAEGE
jgi:hypothetical protein